MLLYHKAPLFEPASTFAAGSFTDNADDPNYEPVVLLSASNVASLHGTVYHFSCEENADGALEPVNKPQEVLAESRFWKQVQTQMIDDIEAYLAP